MARKIIWSVNARKIRKKILKYWTKRNRSNSYSIILNKLFEKSSSQIAEFPYSGILITNQIYRGKLVKDNYLLYKVEEGAVRILFIWDCRKDPKELLKIKKDFNL